MVFPLVFISLYIVVYGSLVLQGSGLLDRNGCPIGGDFILYYAASQQVQGPDKLAVYDVEQLSQLERQITQYKKQEYLGWFYPPILLLLVYPLAKLPFVGALVLWLGLALAAYLAVGQKIAPHPWTWVVMLAFPGTFFNIINGQNGFLSAVLIGQCLLLLEERPRLAGIMLGLLVYKPHLGFLLALALVAAGRWTALRSAAVTAMVLALGATLCFGLESWIDFARSLPIVRVMLAEGYFAWTKAPTVYAAARLLGGSDGVALGLQSGVGVLTIGAVVWSWRRRVAPYSNAILLTGIFLITPYAFVYDLPIFGLAILWYGWECVQTGWLSGERLALTIAAVLPLFFADIALGTAIQPAPLVFAAVLIMVLWRQKRMLQKNIAKAAM
jgi:hypothetical protein